MSKIKLTLCIALISIVLLNITIVYSTNISNNNIKNFFRIHVVANSDSIDDQLIKYSVAKKVNDFITDITANSLSKEESKVIIEANLDKILIICQNELDALNCSYNAYIKLGKIYYDEKVNEDFFMDSGIYDSIQIVLGSGKGQNWWSLIYPNEIKEAVESDETYYTFGIFEFIQNRLHLFIQM